MPKRRTTTLKFIPTGKFGVLTVPSSGEVAFAPSAVATTTSTQRVEHVDRFNKEKLGTDTTTTSPAAAAAVATNSAQSTTPPVALPQQPSTTNPQDSAESSSPLVSSNNPKTNTTTVETMEQPPASDAVKAGKKEKKVPEGLVIPPKKPKLSKAERRALQEQQRAAKAAGHKGGGGQKQQQPSSDQAKDGGKDGKGQDQQQQQQQGKGGAKSQAKGGAPAAASSPSGPTQQSPTVVVQDPVQKLVPHLVRRSNPQEMFQTGATLQHRSVPLHGAHKRSGATSSSGQQQYALHPKVIELGYKYATGEIRGGNRRCRHMLECLEQVMLDFVSPSSSTSASSRPSAASSSEPATATDERGPVLDLLKTCFQFWTEECRPHSVSMGNAFTVLKAAVTSLSRDTPYPEIREVLLETIQAFKRERIEFADRAIADLAVTKLLHPSDNNNGAEEVILTYGYSEVVAQILQQAAAVASDPSSFRVIVVDSRPLLEGQQLLSLLCDAGIDCTYVLLNALTYVLPDVSKVLLGASALMSDGSVWGRVGTATVALAAQANHLPVLVCSETYKISHRVQLESLTNNECWNESTTTTAADEEGTKIPELNLMYDLTPSSFVSGIVTELGIIPPTSVAVLLRELNQLA